MFTRNSRLETLIGLGLGALLVAASLGADTPKARSRRVSHVTQTQTSKTPAPAPTDAATTDSEPATVDVLKGLQNGQLSVSAEGTGDGRMTMSLTNRTNTKLRVVLPPGLIASGATGQFGGGMGMGGGMMGGMGGGMGGMGMGGLGGGMMGGMGGGMGGMGGRGGMMGGRGGMMGGGTLPASMGMMMLGRLIMSLVGDRDSWDQRSLMMGMMGGMGGGGMGGMGGGMGGMMGGMGGGMRSVAATGPLSTSLDPHQVRHLPTAVVSLNGPDANAQPAVPAKGEKLRILGIDQATDDARTQAALKQLAEAKAPRTVAQMVLWYVTAGANWEDIGRLSQGWGNAHEIALARQFVARLDQTEDKVKAKVKLDPGPLYWEIKTQGDTSSELVDGLRALWGKYPVLGLTAREGIPASPNGPALACRLELSQTAVDVKLTASHPSGGDWINIASFKIKLAELAPNPEESVKDDAPLTSTQEQERHAARLGGAVAEAMLARLVRVQLTHGPREKGKETFRVKIVNSSPMILNSLAAQREGPRSTKTICLRFWRG